MRLQTQLPHENAHGDPLININPIIIFLRDTIIWTSKIQLKILKQKKCLNLQ
jgi:hypothetical protein